MPIKATVCYKSVIHGRLFFAYTFDPIYHKAWLQSKKRTYLRIVGSYAGKLAPDLQMRFGRAQQPDGSFEATPRLVSYLDSLPKAKFIAKTRRKRARVLHRPPGVLVRALTLNDLPEQASVSDVARVLGVSNMALRTWRREGLPVSQTGRNIWIAREELRAWLISAGRLMD